MDILKMNKIKIFIICVFLVIFSISLKTNVSATTNSFIKITNIEVNFKNQAIKFSIENDLSTNISEYGILLSKSNEELVLENANIYKYKITSKITNNLSISIKIPEYAFYQNIYAVAYAVIEEEVIYSDKVFSSYAKLANLDKVIIKDINFKNNSLIFNMAASLENNTEYGLIFSKSELINDLTLENAKNAHFETEIIKLEALNENNEYQVTINNIPICELNTTFKACAYVMNKETKETYYTKTYQINILDMYFNEILNNIEISYNKDIDGIKFKTTSSLINNNNYKLGFIFINKEKSHLDINTENAYIVDITSNNFTVNMKNIPSSKLNEEIYVVSYIKFINISNEYEYYYSNIYKTSYNKVKDTYLTNNS